MRFVNLMNKYSGITAIKKLIFKTGSEKPTLRLEAIWAIGVGIWVFAIAALYLENRAKNSPRPNQIYIPKKARQVVINLPKVNRPSGVKDLASSATSAIEYHRRSTGQRDLILGAGSGQMLIDYSIKENRPSTLTPAPSGSSFIAVLQTAIDTRLQNSLVRLSLDRNAIYHGQTFLAKGSTLLATARGSSRSGRIELNVNQAILPSGLELPIAALALDSKDFSPGISATCHSGRIGRTLSRGALNILSAGASLLVTSNLPSSSGSVAAHRSIENAGAQGLSEATKSEADGLENEVNDDDYCALGKGQMLILTLLKQFSPTGEMR